MKPRPEEVVAKTAIELLVEAGLDRDGHQTEIYPDFIHLQVITEILVPFPDLDHVVIEFSNFGVAGKGRQGRHQTAEDCSNCPSPFFSVRLNGNR